MGGVSDQDSKVARCPPPMILPEELGSWRTQLQDATDQALTLIQRGWSCRKVELTNPYAAQRRSEEESMNTQHNSVNTFTEANTNSSSHTISTHTQTFTYPRN